MRRLLAWIRRSRPVIRASLYEETMSAGWLVAPPFARHASPASAPAQAQPDADSFLARFYRHQDC